MKRETTKTMDKTNNVTMKTLVSGTSIFTEKENEDRSITFVPKESMPRPLKGFCGDAYLLQKEDGGFVVKIRKRNWKQSHVIKRMNHGCLVRTRDNAVLLTIKIFHPDENDVAKIIINESWEAAKAYNELVEN